MGKSDIHDLIHHDADEHKREGPAQQDDAGVRGASTQDGGELGERRCLECNCTDTPSGAKVQGVRIRMHPLFPESFLDFSTERNRDWTGISRLCNVCGLR